MLTTKVCSKCLEEKPLDDFHAASTGKLGRRGDCKNCVRFRMHSNYQANPEEVLAKRRVSCVCGNMKSAYSVECLPCSRITKAAEWNVTVHGYVRKHVDGREVKQHRVVMEDFLGRPLLPHETVYHKNGQRADNRLENLELWSTAQPAGQRVEDKLEWCKWFIEQYNGE